MSGTMLRKPALRVLFPLLLTVCLLCTGCKTQVFPGLSASPIPVGSVVSLQLESSFFIGGFGSQFTVENASVSNNCMKYLGTDGSGAVFIATAAGSCEITLISGSQQATQQFTVTDAGLEDQFYPYDGTPKAFSVGSYTVPVQIRVAYSKDNVPVEPIMMTDAGTYNVELTLIPESRQDTAITLERTLTITENEAWEAHLFSLRRDDPQLQAEAQQSVNWTGEQLLPVYTVAEGAVVQARCTTDCTSPGVHPVTLFVEEGNGFAAGQAEVELTINPLVTYVLADGSRQELYAPYGGEAVSPEAPNGEGYTFIGWDRELTGITENITVNGVYDWLEYPVTFKMNDMTYTLLLRAGTMPEVPIEKAQSRAPAGKSFTGWDKDITPATEKVTYTAIYE